MFFRRFGQVHRVERHLVQQVEADRTRNFGGNEPGRVQQENEVERNPNANKQTDRQTNEKEEERNHHNYSKDLVTKITRTNNKTWSGMIFLDSILNFKNDINNFFSL